MNSSSFSSTSPQPRSRPGSRAPDSNPHHLLATYSALHVSTTRYVSNPYLPVGLWAGHSGQDVTRHSASGAAFDIADPAVCTNVAMCIPAPVLGAVSCKRSHGDQRSYAPHVLYIAVVSAAREPVPPLLVTPVAPPLCTPLQCIRHKVKQLLIQRKSSQGTSPNTNHVRDENSPTPSLEPSPRCPLRHWYFSTPLCLTQACPSKPRLQSHRRQSRRRTLTYVPASAVQSCTNHKFLERVQTHVLTFDSTQHKCRSKPSQASPTTLSIHACILRPTAQCIPDCACFGIGAFTAHNRVRTWKTTTPPLFRSAYGTTNKSDSCHASRHWRSSSLLSSLCSPALNANRSKHHE